MGYYETSIICINGHFISSGGNFQQNKFCRECGEKNISACEECNTPIRGKYISDTILSLKKYSYVPSYCHNCGASYPWTQKLLEKTRKLIALDESLSDAEKDDLFDSAKSIMVESDSVSIDASIFKKLADKAGGFLKEALYKFAVDVASETAKKVIISE